MKKFNEIISLSRAELLHELQKSIKELHEYRLANALRQMKETHKICDTRRYVAQLKTALAQLPAKPVVATPKQKKITPAKKVKTITREIKKGASTKTTSEKSLT